MSRGVGRGETIKIKLKKKFQEIKTEVLNFINVKISFIFDIKYLFAILYL